MLMNSRTSNRLFAAALSAAFFILISWLSRSVHGGWSGKALLLAAVTAAAAFLMNYRNVASSPGYIRETLGLGPAPDISKLAGSDPDKSESGGNNAAADNPAKNAKPRDARYDWLRLFAVLFVVTAHTIDGTLPFLSVPLEGAMQEAFDRTPYAVSFFFAALRAFLVAGNSTFVMMSGALLLGWRDEGVGAFYRKRALKVALPVIFYHIFYMWLNRHLTPLTPDAVLYCVHRILSGDFGGECPFMWLTYVLLSFYLTVPFLRYLFRGMPYRTLTAFAIVILLSMAVNIYSPLNKFYMPFISSWTGMAVIGYWVTRPETERYYRFLLAAGLLSVILLIRGTDPAGFTTGYLDRLVQCSPIGMGVATGLFAFIFRFKAFFAKPRPWLSLLANNSFTILLLHWWALYSVVKSALGISGAWFNPPSFAANIVLTIVIALCCGIVLDHTLLALVSAGVEKACDLVGKLPRLLRN